VLIFLQLLRFIFSTIIQQVLSVSLLTADRRINYCTFFLHYEQMNDNSCLYTCSPGSVLRFAVVIFCVTSVTRRLLYTTTSIHVCTTVLNDYTLAQKNLTAFRDHQHWRHLVARTQCKVTRTSYFFISRINCNKARVVSRTSRSDWWERSILCWGGAVAKTTDSAAGDVHACAFR